MEANSVGKLNQILRNSISLERINTILDDVSKKVYDDILSLAPEDTGSYKSSIKISEIEHQGSQHSIKIYTDLNSGWKNVPLGCLIEWGTGIVGQETNEFDHGYPYRTTPWVYFNERYNRWVFTRGNKARPHFFPGLYLNEDYFNEKIKEVITHD